MDGDAFRAAHYFYLLTFPLTALFVCRRLGFSFGVTLDVGEVRTIERPLVLPRGNYVVRLERVTKWRPIRISGLVCEEELGRAK